MDKSNGYLPKVIELLNKIENEQYGGEQYGEQNDAGDKNLRQTGE